MLAIRLKRRASAAAGSSGFRRALIIDTVRENSLRFRLAMLSALTPSNTLFVLSWWLLGRVF
jgi:hypothetical protein